MIYQAQLEAAAAWAYSSVVEHCVDIAGVASSILATPTIFPLAMSSPINCGVCCINSSAAVSALAWRKTRPVFMCAGEGAEVAITKQQRDLAQRAVVFYEV